MSETTKALCYLSDAEQCLLRSAGEGNQRWVTQARHALNAAYQSVCRELGQRDGVRPGELEGRSWREQHEIDGLQQEVVNLRRKVSLTQGVQAVRDELREKLAKRGRLMQSVIDERDALRAEVERWKDAEGQVSAMLNDAEKERDALRAELHRVTEQHGCLGRARTGTPEQACWVRADAKLLKAGAQRAIAALNKRLERYLPNRSPCIDAEVQAVLDRVHRAEKCSDFEGL